MPLRPASKATTNSGFVISMAEAMASLKQVEESSGIATGPCHFHG
jgi:hypothetical protein